MEEQPLKLAFALLMLLVVNFGEHALGVTKSLTSERHVMESSSSEGHLDSSNLVHLTDDLMTRLTTSLAQAEANYEDGNDSGDDHFAARAVASFALKCAYWTAAAEAVNDFAESSQRWPNLHRAFEAATAASQTSSWAQACLNSLYVRALRTVGAEAYRVAKQEAQRVHIRAHNAAHRTFAAALSSSDELSPEWLGTLACQAAEELAMEALAEHAEELWPKLYQLTKQRLEIVGVPAYLQSTSSLRDEGRSSEAAEDLSEQEQQLTFMKATDRRSRERMHCNIFAVFSKAWTELREYLAFRDPC